MDCDTGIYHETLASTSVCEHLHLDSGQGIHVQILCPLLLESTGRCGLLHDATGIKLPAGKILIPGVIAHTTNCVEHPELVAERIMRYTRMVGRENVIASVDCGFAQGLATARVHPSNMWEKFRMLAEGARLATRRLWN